MGFIDKSFIERRRPFKMLVLGEPSSEKYRTVGNLVLFLAKHYDKERITLIDLFPDVLIINNTKITGKISEIIDLPSNVDYRSPNGLNFPIMKAKSKEGYISIVKENVRKVEKVLREFASSPNKILVINEFSIYFPIANLDLIDTVVDKPEIAIFSVNYGYLLSEDLGTGLSSRESTVTEYLMRKVDLAYYVPPPFYLFEME